MRQKAASALGQTGLGTGVDQTCMAKLVAAFEENGVQDCAGLIRALGKVGKELASIPVLSRGLKRRIRWCGRPR